MVGLISWTHSLVLRCPDTEPSMISDAISGGDQTASIVVLDRSQDSTPDASRLNHRFPLLITRKYSPSRYTFR